MQQLFRLSQRFKPETSVEQYALLLRAAFVEWRSAPEPPESMIPGSPDMVRYLREQSSFWERLNSRRLELESVRPDARLARIHEESIKFLRGTLTVFNILAASTHALLQGNLEEGYRKNQEAESWAPVLGSVSQKLGIALSQVQDQQPTLFSMLGLPLEVLAYFGVQITDASKVKEYVLSILRVELSDPDMDSGTWEASIEKLEALGDAGVDALLDCIRDEDEEIWAPAAFALGSIGERSVPGLMLALRDQRASVRLAGVTGLGTWGSPAIADLLPMLRDHDWDVRVGASMMLSGIGFPAVAGLRQMLDDENLEARKLAAEALRNIGYS